MFRVREHEITEQDRIPVQHFLRIHFEAIFDLGTNQLVQPVPVFIIDQPILEYPTRLMVPGSACEDEEGHTVWTWLCHAIQIMDFLRNTPSRCYELLSAAIKIGP